ncbi:phospholipase D-like domain-containing protein [Halobacillus salinarum]|uniref:phospholipase D n=1 Tax=Halobacillus salinarum TaxID=2932257 RepID=A0ABY4EH32_9BACI|nr:phospholipase D-like domain-containing protein [Halobacillus salinarum]UOQ43778.1 phospholipase D-like domain-containing protein [Halobacillus salinarum]
MELFTGAAAALILGSMSYGVYVFTKKEKTVVLEPNKIKYVFSKSSKSPKEKLIEVIDKSKESLDVAIFTFTEKEIAAHICKATKRGVNVRVITDRNQTRDIPRQKENVEKLMEAGIPVKVNDHNGLMHLKITISDKRLTTSGSYNFTYTAEEKNDEVMLVIKDKEMAEEWTKKFDSMWNDSIQFSNYLAQPEEKSA